jgi:hypothetical protein
LRHCSLHLHPTAVALPHVTGSPGLGVLRRLRPARRVQLTVRLSQPGPLAAHPAGADTRRFPCSLLLTRSRRSPALPQRPRHGYAADLHHGLPRRGFHRPRKSPATIDRDAPHPAHIRQIRAGIALRGVTAPVPRVLLSTTLTGPTPSGSTDAPRLCRGCSHPPRHLPDQAAPSYAEPPRRPDGDGLSPPLEQVRSTRGALPVLLPVGFPASPPEPGVHLTAHRALHKPRGIAWVPLTLCSATVSGSALPGSSSASRVPVPGRKVPRHRRRAICRSVGVAPSRPCADACALAT